MSAAFEVALWGLVFLGGHVVGSHPPVRDVLFRALGARGFRGVYSLVSGVAFGLMTYAWWTGRQEGFVHWDLRASSGLVHTLELIALLGFALVGGGATSPAPSSMTSPQSGGGAIEICGLAVVTRMPVLTGIALWSTSHLIALGRTTDLAFFGTVLATSIVGGLHLDWRHTRKSARYAEYRGKTNLFLGLPRAPFRQVGARAWVGVAGGIAAAGALRMMHDAWFRG